MGLVLLMGFICSILGYLGRTFALAIPSALANSFTAWSEFIDISRKIERYNAAISGLQQLLVWWESLGEVEQSSTLNVVQLVQGGENIINSESFAWRSIATPTDKEGKKKEKKKEEKLEGEMADFISK